MSILCPEEHQQIIIVENTTINISLDLSHALLSVPFSLSFIFNFPLSLSLPPEHVAHNQCEGW